MILNIQGCKRGGKIFFYIKGMPYGSLYFGKTGFFYKKSVTSARKNPPIGLLNCSSTDIFNKYTPGAGVGAQSRSVRRAKLR